MTGPVSDSGSGDGARKPIAVFLLDDHEIVRRGVRDLLEAEPDIEVVGEAGHRVLGAGPHSRAEAGVAVLDVRLPDGDGVSVCREIRSKMPEVACLMLTSFGDDEALFDAIMAGAAGIRTEADPRHQPGRRGAHGGLRPVDAGPAGGEPADGQAARSVGQARSAGRAVRAGARILELIGEGLTNRQIGERMFLAEKTVKNYVSALFAKLGMERRTQAAVPRPASSATSLTTATANRTGGPPVPAI